MGYSASIVGCIAICLSVASSTVALGKVMVLPKGVGIWKYAVRSYTSMSSSFDRDGYVQSTGEDFKQTFKGQDLVREGTSSDLGTLANEVQRFDYSSNGGLLGGLDLGTLDVDVSASVNAQIFGTGYGVTDWLTVYGGVPYMSVEVSTDMRFSGKNTAKDLKDRLGDLSYDELSDGLDKAGGLNVYMIKETLMELGYTGIESWDHQGFGDINLGAIMAKSFKVASKVETSPYGKLNVTLPTGHVDDPNVLTDTSVGLGYFSSYVTLGQSVTYNKWIHAGFEGSFQFNQTHDKYIRRPENQWSSLAPIDNLETIVVDPGDHREFSFYAGIEYSLFSVKAMLTDFTKERDILLYETEDIYNRFSVDTDQTSFYQTLSASISTAELYQSGSFPIPFIFTATHKNNYHGTNTVIDDFYEFELASFYTFN